MSKTMIVSEETHKYIKTYCALHMENCTLSDFVDKICNGQVSQQKFKEFVEFSKKYNFIKK